MGNIFFLIARTFSTLIAGIALVGAAWLAITGVTQIYSPDKEAPPPSHPTFAAYIDSIAQKGAADTTDPQSSNTQGLDDASKRFFAHIDKITANLNIYGAVAQVGYVDKNSLREFLLQSLNNDNTDTIEDYMAQLETFSGEMASSASAIKKVAVHNPAKASFDLIIKWFDTEYRQESKDYEAGVETTEAANTARIAGGHLNLIIAVIFFGIFIAFTMLLVLLQVERNTRPSKSVANT